MAASLDQTYDAVILGAGIVGSACARELAQAGIRVAIVEAGEPGGGATSAGMGHLVAMDDSPAQLALTLYSRGVWRELRPELPEAAEYEPRGTLWIAADDEEMEEVHAKLKTFASVGVDAMALDSDQVAKEEPALRPGLAGGLLVPGDAVIYPPAAAAYFLEQAQRLGAILIAGNAAVRSGQGEVELADGTVLRAGAIVVATGAERGVLPWLPIQKRKGHLLLTERYAGTVKHQIVELGYLKSAHTIAVDSVAFNLQPRRNGQLLIGSSRQYGNEDPAVEPAIMQAMLERAYSYMPVLEQLQPARVWAGFRAATPDKLPLLGPTEDATVFLAVGFEGLGITSAPGAARLVADSVLGRETGIPIGPYLASRASLAGAAHG
jgi:glycine/D-amino acid oxidase-like deaminating enzyme